MSGRILDPVTTAIAAEFGTTVTAVATLSSAYALPFAISQPFLGPLGDLFPKVSIITIATTFLALFLALAAMAPDLTTLFAARIVAGVGGAGIVPVGFALIGDRVPLAGRQLAISRLVAASLIGQLIGASAAGILNDALGWRGVLWLSALITFCIAGAARLMLPRDQPPRRAPFHIGLAIANYRSVLRNPLSFVCFSVVLMEGATIYGVLPFIGAHLQSLGSGGSREAGIVIAGLAAGGLLYALAAPVLLHLLKRRKMMLIGGMIAAGGLTCLGFGATWPLEATFMATIGLGLFMLHNSVQTEVSELATSARASAFSLHACSFYLGQAIGPLLYGVGVRRVGLVDSLDLAALGMFVTGLLAFRLFRPA
jgi:predicted MFS family arabinose efflux permease